MLVAFCVARIVGLSLRLAWAAEPTNINLAIAAAVFTSAGVLLLFVLNLVLALRVLRGWHPRFGWSNGVAWVFKCLVASILAVLVMVVVCTVRTLFTLDAGARQSMRDVLLFAGVYVTVVAFLPALAMALTVVVPRKGPHENFGKGSLWTKTLLVAGTSLLLTAGAGFRTGANFAPRPIGQPAWWHSKPAFYCFNFAIELVVVFVYLVFRFDQRFYVPDGSSRLGDYSGSNNGGVQGHPSVPLGGTAAGALGSADKNRLHGPGPWMA